MSSITDSASKQLDQRMAAAGSAAGSSAPLQASSATFGVNLLTGRAAQSDASSTEADDLIARLMQKLFDLRGVSVAAGSTFEVAETEEEPNNKIYRFKQDQMIKDWKLNIPRHPAGLSFCFEELSIECPRKLNRVQIKDVMETALLSVWQLHFQGKENLYDRFAKLREWQVTFRASGDTGNRKLSVTYPESFNLE